MSGICIGNVSAITISPIDAYFQNDYPGILEDIPCPSRASLWVYGHGMQIHLGFHVKKGEIKTFYTY